MDRVSQITNKPIVDVELSGGEADLIVLGGPQDHHADVAQRTAFFLLPGGQGKPLY